MYQLRLPVPDGSPKELADWLREELQRVSDSQHDTVEGITLDVLHAQPDRIEPGMVVYADGSDWDPGSGEGPYYLSAAGAWEPMFGAGSGSGGQGTLSDTTGAIAVDFSAEPAYVQTAPTGAITYTFTDPATPQRVQIHVLAAASGYGFTFPAGVKSFGTAWTGTTANKEAVLSFWFTGTAGQYLMMGADEA